jgi:hypothetical protein
MAGIEWAAPAFAQLETLPQSLAFEVVRRAREFKAPTQG